MNFGNRVRITSLSFAVFFMPLAGNSYELGTHGRLTYAAYMRSALSVDSYPAELGILVNGNVFGENYYDVYRGDIYERSKTDFEESSKRMPSGVNPLSIEGWLMRGAIREDDVPQFFGSNPADDPYGSIFRVTRHFYDPRNDRGLMIGAFQGDKAPDWGIGASDAFAAENAANTFRRNHFTVFDAREAMFRALTGMSKTGSKAIGAGGVEPSSAADKEAVRKAYWATTFRALGDLVHLIQDMAQPQHTRNDPHAGHDNYEQDGGPLGHASFYEKYIESRATQEPMSGSANQYPPTPLVYDTSPSYPIPRFNNYVSYFSTQHLEPNLTARRGMADYSNRGFFRLTEMRA